MIDDRRQPKCSGKACPSVLCPPKFPHRLPWARSPASAVRNRDLIAHTMRKILP
jgi:hypothetical protein